MKSSKYEYEKSTCSACGGSGYTEIYVDNDEGEEDAVEVECCVCNGSGEC